MSNVSRMFCTASFGALVAVTQLASAASAPTAPSPWTERNGTYVLPATNGEQLAVIALVNPATHTVAYGLRDLPQRMNCAPATMGRGQVFDIEGKRIAFDKECMGGTLTYMPRNLPSKKMFAQALASTATLHVRTATLFPVTFDLRTLPLVRERLEMAVLARRSGDR